MIHITPAVYTKSNREEANWVRRKTMKDDYEIEERKQAAADVMFHYSNFVMASMGNQVRPCDMRLHLMKEISGLPTSLKKDSTTQMAAASPDAMGESSSSGTARLDKADSFRAL